MAKCLPQKYIYLFFKCVLGYQSYGLVSKNAVCNVGIPCRNRFASQLLHFPFNSLLMSPRAAEYGPEPTHAVVTWQGCGRHEPQASPDHVHRPRAWSSWLCPPQQVLRSYAAPPSVIEVLCNAFSQLCVAESWQEAIPDEVLQVREPFSLGPGCWGKRCVHAEQAVL